MSRQSSDATSKPLGQLANLSAAEDFLGFFGVAFEQRVVDVNRLHILKRFHQYLRAAPGLARLDAGAQFEAGRALLARAYRDFVRSTPAQEKVFRVFQDTDGRRVGLERLRAALPSRRDRDGDLPVLQSPARTHRRSGA